MGSKTFPLWNLVAKHCFPYFFIYQIYFTSKTRITIHSGKCMIFPHTPLGLPTSYFAFYFDALFFVADFGPYLKSWSRKSKSTKISELHAATHLNFRIDLLNCVGLTFKTEMWMSYILLPRIALAVRNETKNHPTFPIFQSEPLDTFNLLALNTNELILSLLAHSWPLKMQWKFSNP